MRFRGRGRLRSDSSATEGGRHELEDAPRTAGIVGGAIVDAGGGWAFVLSDLKTLLETGSSSNGS
jgi:hypothetical protein